MLSDTRIKVGLEMLFLSINNANVKVTELEKLTWIFYTVVEVLLIIIHIKLINKEEFSKIALDANLENFVVYMSALKATKVVDLF